MKNKCEPSSSSLGAKDSLKAIFKGLFSEMPYFLLFSKTTDMWFCPQEIFLSAELHFMKLETCHFFNKNNQSSLCFHERL